MPLWNPRGSRAQSTGSDAPRASCCPSGQWAWLSGRSPGWEPWGGRLA